jgi:AcrR family transcriptional regulator
VLLIGPFLPSGVGHHRGACPFAKTAADGGAVSARGPAAHVVTGQATETVQMQALLRPGPTCSCARDRTRITRRYHGVMAPDPGPTRRKLIDAATALFARHGVTGVSRAEIGRAAGQRNTAALVYHFGDLDGILRAVLGENVARLRERRMAMLGDATAASPTEVRPVMEALVLARADLAAGDWRDRAYAQIHADLTGHPAWTTEAVAHATRNGGGPEVTAELVRRTPDVPAGLQADRILLVAAFVVRATAARARALDMGAADPTEYSRTHALFASNMVDVAVAAVTAPVSEATRMAGGVTLA